ncbi:hypothetical protein D3C81_830240 [compost metagenome]
MANIATTFGGERAQSGIAQTNSAGLQINHCTLGTVQPCIQGQALQVIVSLGQLLALQGQRALRRLQGSGDFQLTLELPLQVRPELAKTRQIEVQLTGQALLQAATAVDVVVAQADIESAEGPGLSSTLSDSLEHCRLTAQTPLEVKVGVQAEFAIFDLALAA